MQSITSDADRRGREFLGRGDRAGRGKEEDTVEKNLRKVIHVVVGIWLACLISPTLKAEPKGGAAADTTTALAQEARNLRAEVERLKAKLVSLKQQRDGSSIGSSTLSHAARRPMPAIVI